MIIDVFKKNKGNKFVYSSIEAIDYYDGAMTGIFKLDGPEQWYIFNLSFFDPLKNQRLFSIIETSDEWVSTFKTMMESDDRGMLTNYEDVKKRIQEAFRNYKSNVYLMKAERIEGIHYEIVQIPLSYLTYFDSIEETFQQNEKSIQQLKAFFQHSHDSGIQNRTEMP